MPRYIPGDKVGWLEQSTLRAEKVSAYICVSSLHNQLISQRQRPGKINGSGCTVDVNPIATESGEFTRSEIGLKAFAAGSKRTLPVASSPRRLGPAKCMAPDEKSKSCPAGTFA